jgi:hypothetical protein
MKTGNTECQKQYCAFWYPTIFHQTDHINPIKGQPVSGIDISDKAQSSFRLFLDIQENENGDLTFITYNKAAGSNEKIGKKSLTLTLEKHSNNGFYIYSYETGDVDLHHYLYNNVFYHHAKSLHHQHEVNSDSDSSLAAMVIDEASFKPADIFVPNNIVIRDFLQQYEVLFGEIYAKTISERNRLFDKLLRTFNTIRSDEFKSKIKESSDNELLEIDEFIHKFYYTVLSHLGKSGRSPRDYTPTKHRKRHYYRLIKQIRRLQGAYYQKYVTLLSTLCGNAAIEYTYCQTLLNSKYNTEIKPNIQFSIDEISQLRNSEDSIVCSSPELLRKDLSRKIANNIQNAIRYIECVKYKCSNRASEHIRNVLDEAEAANKRSLVLTIIFGIITFISLVVAIAQVLD